MKGFLCIIIFTAFNISASPQNSDMQNGIHYIHNEKESSSSKFIKFGLKLFGMKGNIERSMRNENFMHEAAKIPRSLKRGFDVSEESVLNRIVWAITPKENKTDKYIIYFHGGAYIHNISKIHWDFLEKLAIKTRATIIVPDYPLAPQANFEETHAMIEKLYELLLKKTEAGNISFIGDSSGGGLALSFAQKLRNERMPLPQKIILLSPWLDVTMDNPEIKEIDKKDRILDIKGLQLAGESFAKGTDPKDHLVSPIYGEFHDLGEISLFIGTHDLFYPDCQKLKDILKKQGAPFNYYEYPKMLHAWMLMTNLKESKNAIEQIAGLLNE